MTVFCEMAGETFHSHHGSVMESEHVFIRHGLRPLLEHTSDIHILEMGFGTGLNALLTLAEVQGKGLRVVYTSRDKFPVSPELVEQLDYARLFNEDLASQYQLMHSVTHGDIQLNGMLLQRELTDITAPLTGNDSYNLVYFDAFSPDKQPELWTVDVFRNIADRMTHGGVLVTYSSKGSVRRAMQAAGLSVEKLPGPPGKREMVRAFRV